MFIMYYECNENFVCLKSENIVIKLVEPYNNRYLWAIYVFMSENSI